jgi:hypothetical protein
LLPLPVGHLTSAGYYRKWRAEHPEYRAREAERAARRRQKGRDRSKEYASRKSRAKAPVEPLGVLFPHLVRGARISFWEDELRMDLAQEAELARLEGRDPEQAVKEYSARENTHRAWVSHGSSYFDELD